MSDRWTARWRRLTLLAIGNFVVWVALAVIVAVLISDRVDLGLETSLRTYQATAIAQWRSDAARPTEATDQLARGDEAFQPLQPDTLPWRPTSAPEGMKREEPPTSSGIEIERGEQVELFPPEAGFSSAQTGPLPLETLGPFSLVTNPSLESLAVELTRSSMGQVVEIQYEEPALNQEIIALLENHPEQPYQLSWIDLKPGGIILTGSSRVWGVPVSIRVEGTLTVERCRPKAEVQSVYIAKVLAPQFAREWVTSRILETMAWFPADYPLCLHEIRLEEERMILYGIRR